MYLEADSTRESEEYKMWNWKEFITSDNIDHSNIIFPVYTAPVTVPDMKALSITLSAGEIQKQKNNKHDCHFKNKVWNVYDQMRGKAVHTWRRTMPTQDMDTRRTIHAKWSKKWKLEPKAHFMTTTWFILSKLGH